jgi:addiction module HigA family antidote
MSSTLTWSTTIKEPDMPMFNPPHPGESLREDVLVPLGLSITETAKALGISRKTLSEIVNGKSPITPDIAVRLERAFAAPPADMWLRLQAAYDLRRAQRRLRNKPVRRLRKAAVDRKVRAA